MSSNSPLKSDRYSVEKGKDKLEGKSHELARCLDQADLDADRPFLDQFEEIARTRPLLKKREGRPWIICRKPITGTQRDYLC